MKKLITKKYLFLTWIISSVFFAIPMLRSGLIYNFGVGLWGPNAHDGLWHIALIKQLKQNVPPLNPIFSGEILTHYHWGFDLVASWVDRIVPLKTINIYFQFLPIIFSFAIGGVSYLLAYKITKNKLTSVIFMLLNYFSGSLGWVVSLAKSGRIGGESFFWSMQSISTLINPPYALSLIIFLTGLILWNMKRDKNNFFWAVAVGIIFGSLSFIKIYAGILAGFSLVFFWIIKTIKRKNNRFDLIVPLTAGLTSLFFLKIMGVLSASGSLIFNPLWFPHSLIESLDRLYLPSLASLRYNLWHQGLSIKLPFLVAIEILLVLVFIIGNMGTRVFGYFNLLKKIKKKVLTNFDLLVLFLQILSVGLPLLFVQNGTTWNTIQFFYYGQIFANFYFAQFLNKLVKNKKFLSLTIIILATVLTTISTLDNYLGYPPPAHLPLNELRALNSLEKKENDIVLTYPYDKYKKNKLSTPIPVYLYETTAYVSAFSAKTSYYEDEINLEITGYSWQERKTQSEKFFSTDDTIWARGFLLNNGIDYIYLVDEQKLSMKPNSLGLEMIFDQENVKIYQVKK
jgi:hypothetical protein